MTDAEEVSENNEEMGDIQEELARAQARIDELETELGLRKGGNGDKAARAEHYRRGIEVLRSSQEHTREALDEATRRLKKAEFDLNFQEQAAKTQVLRFQEEMALLQQQLENSMAATESEREESRQLRAELERSAQSLKHMKEVLQERDLQIGRQQEEMRQPGDGAERGDDRELAALRIELEQALSARRAAEQEIVRLEQQVAGDEGAELRAEIERMTAELEESNQLREEITRRAQRLEAELNAQGVVSGRDEVTVIKKLRRQKETAEERVRQLESELAQIKSAMEQPVGRRTEGDGSVDEDALEALRSELELVRERAETDLARMREETAEMQSRLEAQQLGSAAEVAENQALRQEKERLLRQMEEHKEELQQVVRERSDLQEKVEERNSEIDRLNQALEMARSETEEAESRHQEELEARRQVESALYQSRQALDRLTGRELAADGPDKSFDGAARRNRRSLLGAALLGAVFAAAVLAGLFALRGGDERADSPLAGSQGARPAARAARVGAPVPSSDTPELTGRQNPSPPAAVGAAAAKEKPGTEQTVGKARPATGTLIRDRLRSGGKGPEMVYVRGGTFSMGNGRDQITPAEQPVHPVEVKDFAIGRYEVSFDEYQRFARATGRPLPGDQGWGRGDRPVVNVSWSDARAYARWLSRETGQRYRLPTEAEWEYAAAGGTGSYYWWGYDLGKGNANCFNCGSRWDGKSTAPVGSFSPNPFGLYDMTGNVMEWVEDCYHPDYRGAPSDGSAWVEEGCALRVVRGGGFNKPGDTLRTTKRRGLRHATRHPVLGFRVVREVD